MTRYEDVGSDVYKLLKELIEERFTELRNCNIKLLFDNKKKKSKGKLVLAQIQKPNEFVKFFTIDEAGTDRGYDYIITIDKVCWGLADEDDKKRLLSHELRHTDVDIDSERNPYKLRGHTVEDFMEEIELNSDNPRWCERLVISTEAMYENGEE